MTYRALIGETVGAAPSQNLGAGESALGGKIMAKDARQPISFHINSRGDAIPVDAFMEVLNECLGCMRGIDEHLSGSVNLRWGISEISKTNPLVCTLTPKLVRREDARDSSKAVVGAFLNGLRDLQDHAKRPPSFDDDILSRLKKIPLILNGDVNEIRVDSPNFGAVSFGLALTSNIEQIVAKEPQYYYEFSSLAGVLAAVAWTKGEEARFHVQDLATGEKTPCFFKAEEADRAARAWATKARIIVYGKLKYAKDGSLQKVDVDEWDELPNASDLPQIADFADIDLIGDEAPEVSIRRGRNAN